MSRFAPAVTLQRAFVDSMNPAMALTDIEGALSALESSRPQYMHQPAALVGGGSTPVDATQSEGAKPKGCDAIMNGWFSELSEFWPGQALSLEVDSVLHHEQTEYQDLLVFKSKAYGNVLVLDGAIQATQRDEFSYQEMIAHLPMCGHPNPKRALVVGGGDGGVLRELCRHPGLEEIVLCELDRAVPEASKKFLPQMAVGFDDPRVTVRH